jgi:hypothetical protein
MKEGRKGGREREREVGRRRKVRAKKEEEEARS